MTADKLIEKAMEFAVKTIKICETIQGHKEIVSQLELSSALIGERLKELSCASVRNEFREKLRAALNECYKTQYWIELLCKAGVIHSTVYRDLLDDCEDILRIINSSVEKVQL